MTMSTSIAFPWKIPSDFSMHIYSKNGCQTLSFCWTKQSKEAYKLLADHFYTIIAILSAIWCTADIFKICVTQVWTHWPLLSPQPPCISVSRFLDSLEFGKRTFWVFQMILCNSLNHCLLRAVHVQLFQDKRPVKLECSSVMLINVSSEKKENKGSASGNSLKGAS